ncbi:uncharacterized protein LOC124551081 isoform X1 [Schistocerca americana]|uniref:uncharacterized protein LOC124551081 isoform X1 n=1 Tax=Schistocerca americana TaxID=7009 RepID=UPI001F4F793F|nr:uncharacterized protein LOC124551081 isoform X1 [Schistocerca americana]
MMSYGLNDSRELHDSSLNFSLSGELDSSQSKIGKIDCSQFTRSQTINPVLLPPFLLGESSARHSVSGQTKPKEEKVQTDGSFTASTPESEKPKWPPVRTQNDLLENYNFEYSPWYPKKPWDIETDRLSSNAAEANGLDKRSHWARLWVTVLGVPPSLLGRRRVLRLVEDVCRGGRGSICEVAGPVMGGRKMHLRMVTAELASRLLRNNGGLLEMPVEGPPIRAEPCTNQSILDRYEELGKTQPSEQQRHILSPVAQPSWRGTNETVGWAVRQAQARYSVKPEVVPPHKLRRSWQEELVHRYSL